MCDEQRTEMKFSPLGEQQVKIHSVAKSPDFGI
jgi:hypothetical protein